MKQAVRYEFIDGCIQLFDADDNKLDGKGTHWEGDFYCSYSNLTSLEGAPKTVGGDFYCYDNNLTNEDHAPTTNADMFNAFLKNGYIFANGILTKLISKRGNVYKTQRIGKDETVYVIKQDGLYAHGKTIKEAKDDLTFKIMRKNPEQFKGMDLNTKKTPQEWGKIYRAVTGSCQYGVNEFIKGQSDLKKEYTLSEILDKTKNAYMGLRFKEIIKGE